VRPEAISRDASPTAFRHRDGVPRTSECDDLLFPLAAQHQPCLASLQHDLEIGGIAG
jgi:hypothetical protein